MLHKDSSGAAGRYNALTSRTTRWLHYQGIQLFPSPRCLTHVHCATADAVANTSAGMGLCNFQVIAMGFSPEWWT